MVRTLIQKFVDGTISASEYMRLLQKEKGQDDNDSGTTVSKEYVDSAVDTLIQKGLKSNDILLIEKCMDDDSEVSGTAYHIYKRVDAIEKEEEYRQANEDMVQIRKEPKSELDKIVKVAGESPAQREARFWTSPKGQALWERYSRADRAINQE